MRVSCSVPSKTASDDLVRKITQLGLTPIITGQVIRTVYEGPSRVVGETIMEIYQHERDHEITVDYGQKQKKQNRKCSK